ncbi:MAG TPA: N-acetylmuramoyl-L-alanine amidase [Candidatus Anaerostipes avistercoris]|uniref:N-acetylmuramoyl-L-alanine amidase n=1 Tax=Candidatus Anaerostipes avistercoris TaxID=2838462 RepID=A0A9D2PJ81_9FIRM|nr:N-acetylmuramoyl-L-alanine amidase [uncultured Anaerostipes sp.]HJC49848.1 N-acetylmuramoyl-L-alanine amidase [Candidatus Anaerostipes avistercoris]
MLKKKILCLTMALMLLLVQAQPAQASVAAGKYFKIQYTHNKKVYSKKAVAARFQNKTIKTNMPGFIEGNTSMYSAYWVFGRCSGLGIKYSYSGKTKKITLKRGSNTLIMTVNSRNAVLNGKKFRLPAAPRSIRYVAKKKNYIMVPGEVTAKKLGLNYSWNNRLLSGLITLRKTSSGSTSTSASPGSSVLSGTDTKITASSGNYSVRIKRPSGLSLSAVSAEDDYHNTRLRLIINGNHKSHFAASASRSVKEPVSYSVSYSGGKTYVDLKTSAVKGFSVTQTSSYIYVKYAPPKEMFRRVLVVDAGHGGHDPGAVGNGYSEKNLTLKIVQAVKQQFDRNPAYKVYYTRLSDWYPSLSYRYQLANNTGADRFLSVHINSASSSARGTETLYKTYKTYAQNVQDNALKGMGYAKGGGYDRGLKYRTDLAVLNGPKMTTALVEMGFISNQTEASRINSRTSEIGKYLYQALCNSF